VQQGLNSAAFTGAVLLAIGDLALAVAASANAASAIIIIMLPIKP
jgi:dipeptide/tripeptide permease